MAAPQTSSRLQLLQARFQQKQLQEKEQKLLQLYDQQQQRAHQVAQRGSAGSNSSAGSAHGTAIGNQTGKVRQMFVEKDRRQNNGKGIDKSYPLEPLNGRSKKHSAATASKSVNATTSGRRNVVGTVKRTSVVVSQRDGVLSRESYTSSSRGIYGESIARRESYGHERGDYDDIDENGKIKEQINGHQVAKNDQPYETHEINIDEVIDNEAMERNRMVAKFHPLDIEKRRRFSTEAESEEFPEEAQRDVPDKASEKPSARKFSQSEPPRAERFKNTNTRKSNATTATKKRSEPTIPTGANARQSTLMKTTKSASLKIRKKLPRSKKVAEKEKKSTLSKSKKVLEEESKKTIDESNDVEDRKENIPADYWDALKSTSLICQIIRSHEKIEQYNGADTDKVGIVQAMVTKIENTTSTDAKTEDLKNINVDTKSDEKNLQRFKKGNSKQSTPTRLAKKKRQSLFNSNLCKTITTTSINNENDERREERFFEKIEIENKDQEDGLICREEINTSLTRQNRESSVEHPTDYQEITIADQTIKVSKEADEQRKPSQNNILKLTCEREHGARRASFELKRTMFEQIRNEEKFSRRDSVDSAQRNFELIGVDVTDAAEEPVSNKVENEHAKEREKSQKIEKPSESFDVKNSSSTSQNFNSIKESKIKTTLERCEKNLTNKEELRKRIVKGFERHTKSWSIKTSKRQTAKSTKCCIKTKKSTMARKVRRNPNKKLLDARNSIELARVSVKSKLPACKVKLSIDSNDECGTIKENLRIDYRNAQAENDETMKPVKIQSFSDKNRIDRIKNAIFSTKQTFNNNKKCSSSTTKHPNADIGSKKSFVFNTKAKKNITPYPSSKSPDNTSESYRQETKSSSLKFLNQIVGSNGNISSAAENGFSTADRKSVSPTYSTTDSKNRHFEDEKPTSSMAPAPRTVSSLSSSVATNRSQGSTNARITARTKSNATPPTPAARLSAQPKSVISNDDSLTTCKICKRRFITERISLHEQICTKTSQKKRKQFDTLTHRVKGTELESFVQKPPKSKNQLKVAKSESPKSNWRRKHEEFINAIRSAKQIQIHLAAGGKLSDLPPPPASDTSDYVQCPHCSRKFNESAAERHIPKCQNMQHNKPNPRAPPRSKR